MKMFYNQYNMESNKLKQTLLIASKQSPRSPLLCGLFPLVIDYLEVSGVLRKEVGQSRK